MPLSVAFRTLGCKVNQYETVAIREKSRLPNLLDRHLAGERGVTGAVAWAGWRANGAIDHPTLTRSGKASSLVRALAAIERELGFAYRAPFVGKVVRPLVELRRDPATGLLVGLTERYLRVRLAGGDALRNTFPEVRVSRTGHWWVDGELVRAE